MNKFQRAAQCHSAMADCSNALLTRKLGLISTARMFERRVRKAADKLIKAGAYDESKDGKAVASGA